MFTPEYFQQVSKQPGFTGFNNLGAAQFTGSTSFLPGDQRRYPGSSEAGSVSRPLSRAPLSTIPSSSGRRSAPYNPTGGDWRQAQINMQGAPTPIQGRPNAPPMPFQRPSSPMQTFVQPLVQPQQVMPGFGPRPQIKNYNPNLAPGAQRYMPNGLSGSNTGYNPWAPTGSPVGTISVIGGNRGFGGGATIGGDAGPAGQRMRGLGQGWAGQSNFFFR